jgi:hypothetical protein
LSADRHITAQVAFIAGIVTGVLVWSGYMVRARRHLFGRSAIDRGAALGYVGGQPSIESAQLLRDYVKWETRPRLRRRGEHLLRRMEHYLE